MTDLFGDDAPAPKPTPDWVRMLAERMKADEDEVQRLALSIYLAYPRKVGRAAALKAIGMSLIKGEHPGFLMGRVEEYAECTKRWPEKDRGFIPHPSTWFNEERYHDDPDEWRRDGGIVSGADDHTEKHLKFRKF